MANYAETMIITEGPDTLTIQTYLQSDGISGELVDFPILYPRDLTPPLPAKPCFGLWQIWYQVSNFTVSFGWGSSMGLTDPTWVICPGVDSREDFSGFGGVLDSSGTYGNGNLLITTRGFTQLNSTGSFVLRIRKLQPGTVPSYKIVGQTLGVVALP